MPAPRRRPRARSHPDRMSGAGCSAMSSMLTPASLRASASSATVPGRLATTTRSSASGPAADSASWRRRRSSAAEPCQDGDRLGVAAADQLGRIAEPARRVLDRRRDRVPIAGEDVAPDSRVGARDPGRVAKARADLGHPLGVPGQLRRRLGDEDVGDDVGKVADGRHHPVVGLGADRLRPGTEVGDDPLQRVVEDPARALGRGQVPARPVEEVGAGVLDPGGLGPGQRVAADESLVLAERGDEVALGRADVGDDRLGAGGLECRSSERLQSRHRRRAEHRVGLGARRRDTLGAAIEGAELDRALERRRIGVEPDHLDAGTLPSGEPDRAPDQADAKDGELHAWRRLRTDADRLSSRETVVSQSMQASVIDWP